MTAEHKLRQIASSVAGHLRAGLLAAALLAVGAATAAPSWGASPGALDSGFGGGVVELPAGTQLNGVAVQGDGRVVVTGLTGGITDRNLLVARLTPGGALDTSFSGDGMATRPLPPGATGLIGDAVAIQPNGQIVVAADIRAPTGADGMLVTRLNSNGSFDSGFGGGGAATVLRGAGPQAEVNAIAVAPSGEIVIGGAAAPGAAGAATGAVVRLTPGGGQTGAVGYLNNGEATIEALALQPDGRIAVAGSQKAGQVVQTFVGRLNADATKDASFAGDGVLERQLALPGGARSALQAIAVEPDGRLVAAGYALAGADLNAPGIFNVTTRVDQSGNPDGSFGPGGVRYIAGARANSVNTQTATGATGIAVNGGHVYSGGSWDEFGSSALAVQGQNGDGSDDGGFGSGGQTIAPVRSYEAPGYGMALALSPDGLYLAGSSGNLGNDSTTGVVARFGAYPLATPPPPPPPAPPPPPPPGGGGTPPSPPAGSADGPPSPAKLEIARAQVLRSKRQLDVLAPITALSSGDVRVRFQAAGQRTRFKAEINSEKRRIRFRHEIPREQARLGTGILTINYEGDDDTQPQIVRLRAASRKANLDAERPKIEDGRLTAKGEISKLARGVVRLELLYEPPGEQTRTERFDAKIEDGKYEFDEELPDFVQEGIANRQGVVHSYTLFTGYGPRRIRGEMTSYQVAPIP